MKSVLFIITIVSFNVGHCIGQLTDTLTLYAKIDSVVIAYKTDLLSRKGALLERVEVLRTYALERYLNDSQSKELNKYVDSLVNSLVVKTLIYDIGKFIWVFF